MLIKGDGIGPELCTELEKILGTIESITDLSFKLNFIEINEDHYRETELLIPGHLKDLCNDAHVIWLGPIYDNSTLKGYSESAVINRICEELNLDLHLRRLNPLNSLQVIQTENLLNAIIIQNQLSNNTIQGSSPIKYSAQENLDIYTTIYFQDKIFALYLFARQIAESNNYGRVLLALPEELFQENSPWMKALTVFSKTDIKIETLTLDRLIFQLIHNPHNLHLIITLPPFGQILSRMGAAVEGGLGVAFDSYQNINEETALFHVLHPASKHYINKDAANPLGTILCLGEMLHFLKYPGINGVIRETVEESILAGWTTLDLSGSMGTCEIGDFICSKLADKLVSAS